MDEENVGVYIYIHTHIYNGILLDHKEWNITTYSNIDGLREHTNLNKSDIERQILYYIT